MRLASIALILAGIGSGSTAGAQEDPGLSLFETKIRPLFAENCLKCHGAEKQKADLRLDTREGLRKGGESGDTLVVPEKPDTSKLLLAVRHANGAPKMPPGGKLKDSEIADLEAWIKRGAPFPAATNPPGGDPTRHWAFQPVKPGPPPAVRNRAWAKTELDRFVLAKLEAAGLEPAPAADKRTLIRRATYDLTGLPPTPEEVDTFLKDQSETAFATVIERLLASSAYGERWGRHWLDVARYADSNGLDENVAHGNAWRYRDYVIQALNSDKPYDRFLLEQLAGDLLPDGGREGLIATGFLALGPKVLAEPDEKKMEFDIVDEQLDTVGKTVLGLTLGCARCHDHKFDPISMADYYGLAGIFVSTRTMEHFKKVARWHENSLATPEETRKKTEHDAAVARLKERIKALTGKKDGVAAEELKQLQVELAELEKNVPELPFAMGATEGTTTDVPVLRRGNHLSPAAVVPRRFPVVLAGEKQAALPGNQSGRLELARWLTQPENPLTSRVMVNRVWRWHFGKGLVRSVDNFGLLGEKPTHPELLDWLAAKFLEEGWSLKKLHRRILLSATYQMSSSPNTKASLADPDNRLLWRANPRRLEAEAIRDSLLAVSGMLDRSAGGPALTHVKNRDYLFDHTSKDKTTYTSNRRSVYLPVIRNNLYDVFQLFDAPDAAVPTGDRPTTTVPTQALFFLNSRLAIDAADALAGRLLTSPGSDDTGRVRLLFALAFGRPPTENEVTRVLGTVAAFESRLATDPETTRRTRKAWAAACQAILASNEFIHVN